MVKHLTAREDPLGRELMEKAVRARWGHPHQFCESPLCSTCLAYKTLDAMLANLPFPHEDTLPQGPREEALRQGYLAGFERAVRGHENEGSDFESFAHWRETRDQILASLSPKAAPETPTIMDPAEVDAEVALVIPVEVSPEAYARMGGDASKDKVLQDFVKSLRGLAETHEEEAKKQPGPPLGINLYSTTAAVLRASAFLLTASPASASPDSAALAAAAETILRAPASLPAMQRALNAASALAESDEGATANDIVLTYHYALSETQA